MLAIVKALQAWRVYLLGVHFTVVTDHSSLRFLNTQPNLSTRQARWMEFLAEYDYEITYLPGKGNVVADALSRCDAMSVVETGEFVARIRKLTADDEWANRLRNKNNMINSLIYYLDRIYVPGPLRNPVLVEYHDIGIAGHFGVNKIFASLSKIYYWPGMFNDVKKFISSCDVCQRMKTSNTRPAGLLRPLEIPSERWENVSMDFIVQLPRTAAGFDAIFVVVDMLSKMAHFIPTHTMATAPGTARLFFDHIFRLHSMPRVIVSDRDSKFTSNFWSTLFNLMGTKLALSMAFHPQTDSQTERMNRTLEDMLRAYTSLRQDDWDSLLTQAEFTYNNSPSMATQLSPFRMNYRFDPLFPANLGIQRSTDPSLVPSVDRFVDELVTLKQNAVTALRDVQL